MSSIKAYKGAITKVYPHNNANKLQLAEISGYQVVVGLDAKVGDEGILFLPDAILTPVVIEYFGLNYLSKGRVKVTKLRGEWSDALFVTCTEDDLEALGGLDNMWTEYTPVVKQQGVQNVGKIKRGEFSNFKKHQDTQQYRNSIIEIDRLLEYGWTIDYSVKTHGTSARVGNIQLPREPNVLEKTVLKLSAYVRMYKQYQRYLENKYEGKLADDYSIVIGSRNVILNEDTAFDDTNLRVRAAWFKDKLHKDEVIYYEILGYDHTDSPIMNPYQGKPYDYGIPNGEFGIQVYRIVQTGRDLTRYEMYLRCMELGLILVEGLVPQNKSIKNVFELSLDIKHCVTANDMGIHTTIYNHTNEGMVIRLQNPNSGECKFYKLKNREFLLEEGHNPPEVDF